MAKLSIMQKEKKKFLLFNKYYLKNKLLKNKFKSLKIKTDKLSTYMNYNYYLRRIPRNSNGTRIRNRCFVTGRSRGVFRRFGLSRIIIRRMSWRGYTPGILKSCW